MNAKRRGDIRQTFFHVKFFFGRPHLMLSIGLAGFVALPERFFPFSSVSFSPELSWLLWLVHLPWTISQSGSIQLHDDQPEWALPISSKAKIACDFSTSSCALNFRPYRSCGVTSRTLLSLELLSDHCVLILLILYSSTMDLSGSLNRALLL